MLNPRTLAALGLSATISFSFTGAAAASSVGVTCIELQRPVAGLVAVPVRIGAGGILHGPYSFLLDTGSEATFVDEGLADALGLAATSRGTIVTASGPIQAIGSRASITFGSLQVKNLEIVRDPLTELRTIAPGIRGVLGQDVLRRANWLLDYRMGIVVQDPDGLLGEQLRGDRLPVHWIGDRPTVAASFGRATPVRLVLDSAATGIVLFKLPIGVPTGAFARMQTLGIEKNAPIVSVDALHLGSIVVPRPTAAVLPQDRDADETGGLLPTALFDALYFDQHDRTATVTQAAGPRVKVESTKCKVGK